MHVLVSVSIPFYVYILKCLTTCALVFREGWMCRAGEQRWLSPPQLSWTGFLALPVAPAVMTSREWLKWRVWWRNTWLLIAGTCELITFLMLLIPEINGNLSCCFYLFIYWLIYHICFKQGGGVGAGLFRDRSEASLSAPCLAVPVSPPSRSWPAVWWRVAAAGWLDERAGSTALGMLHLK